MKSLKHILGLLMMTAMIIAAGCNKEENGGKKENLPHPNSTYKACPILAHFGNEKLGIKEIHVNNGEDIYVFDKEQRKIKNGNRRSFEYEYDKQGRLITLRENDCVNIISYDAYGFVDSIYYKDEDGSIGYCFTFTYSHDTVFAIRINDDGRISKDILKFSDDLYLVYSADIEHKTWNKYIWKDGNMVSRYNNEGDKYDYQYDNHISIWHLINSENILIGIDSEMFCVNSKNNMIIENKSYTYNDKGMVETISSKDENGVEKVEDSFSYIYY